MGKIEKRMSCCMRDVSLYFVWGSNKEGRVFRVQSKDQDHRDYHRTRQMTANTWKDVAMAQFTMLITSKVTTKDEDYNIIKRIN